MKTNGLTLTLNFASATASAGPARAALAGFAPLARVATPEAKRSARVSARRSEVLRVAPESRAERVVYGLVAVCAAIPVGAALLSTASFAANFNNVLAWVRGFGL